MHHPTTIRLLGHSLLTGCLHAAYTTSTSIAGSYMLVSLFRTHVLLAAPHPHRLPHASSQFRVLALISLSHLSLAPADNGKGLQCHTAPFSFKLVFAHDARLYEIMLSACSPTEERVWHNALTERAIIATDLSHAPSRDEAIDVRCPDLFAVLDFDIKPLGLIYPASRLPAMTNDSSCSSSHDIDNHRAVALGSDRLSIQRAITLSP